MQIPSSPLDRYEPLLGERFAAVREIAAQCRQRYRRRAIWHVNSTMSGGGVAEMLRALLPYVRGAGIDSRWLVLREDEEFFALTKRLHNNLHGNEGDGGELGAGERRTYEHALATSARHFSGLLQPGDVVFLHDPQTAGLAAPLKATGATVIWRCHIGADQPNAAVLRAQDFLLPYVREADAWVFSREGYAWQGLNHGGAWTMAPSIDPFAPKNQELDPEAIEAILGAVGLGPSAPHGAPAFTRADGTPGRVERRAEIVQEERLPADGTVIAQVSRWDRLKGHAGVLACFERHLGGDSHLVLAGPSTAAVSDDPEGASVWAELRAAWRALPDPVRRRVHLASLPLDDLDENAAVVNAIQRRADIVVQKSLAEGFGLTVAEAMWKGKPVVGGRVGGIQDQIVDGESGLLADPHDLEAVATAISTLLADPARAAALGERARERVRERFLGIVRLTEYAEKLSELEERLS